MLLYRASLPLSRSTLTYVTGVVRRRRASLGGRSRALSPGMQALLVLVYLRKGETFAEVGAGFGISTTTAWRYVDETVTLLAARSPKLGQALRKAAADGLSYLVLDGTLIPIDRVREDRPFYSGKHRKHGMNLQVIATPSGDIVWNLGCAARQRARSDGGTDLGCAAGAAGRRAAGTGRQGIQRRRRTAAHPVQGP